MYSCSLHNDIEVRHDSSVSTFAHIAAAACAYPNRIVSYCASPCAGEPTRFMALIPPRRAFRLDSSSVGDLYRAMFQSAGGSDTGVLDVASAVPGGQYVCFDRVVLGWESLSEPITGPQNSHLVWNARFLHKSLC
jgi:hypothetical protein